jgi:DNA-binding GntR family transcriptional regulator
MSRPEVTTAVEAVARDLRAAILAGSPAPGERLREQALAARYDVARHTVRAALRALAAEHLVVIPAHRGARVAQLDDDELRALFELRTALEVEAARLLAERRPPDGSPQPPEVEAAAARLFALCEQADRDTRGEPDNAARADDVRAAVDEAHLALHHALVAAAGSARITAAHAALAAEQRLVLLQSRPALSPARMAAHHRELLDHLPRLGPEALRHHLAQGRAFTSPSGAEDRDVDRSGALLGPQ